jgi:O-antigen/teichoic acid export membrane protein
MTRLWPIALHFFTTPYVVTKLGTDAYGVYAFIFIVLGYFVFLDFGLSKAVIKFVAESAGNNDKERARSIVITALAFYLFIGIIGSIFLYLISGWLVTSVLNIPSKLLTDAIFAFQISATIFFSSMLLQVLIAVPKALARFDLSGKIEITIVTVQTLGPVITITAGGSLKEIAIVIAITTFVTMVLSAIIAIRLLPLWPLKSGYKLHILKLLLKFGGIVATNGILIMLSSRINGFILGIFHPISSFAYYSIAENISSKISNLPRSINETIFPAFSHLGSIGRQDLLKSLFIRSTRYIVLITIPFFILFLVYADKFLEYWLGIEFAEKGAMALQILGAAHLVSFWAYSSVAAARGLNRPDIPLKWEAIIASINFFLCITLTPQYGILGVAIAWSVHRIIVIPLAIRYVGTKIICLSGKIILRECFVNPIFIGVVFFIIAYAARPVVNSMLMLISFMAMLTLLYYFFSYVLVLDNIDRVEVQKFLLKFNKVHTFAKKYP